MIVDDNQDLADAQALFLEVHGHVVRIACDGPEALQAINDFRPDVAIVDIGLPGMDGYEVARRLREIRPSLTLAALSGWRIDLEDRRAQEAGFSMNFMKPADPEAMLDFLDAAGSRSKR